MFLEYLSDSGYATFTTFYFKNILITPVPLAVTPWYPSPSSSYRFA